VVIVELGTFGSILKFALDIETEASEFYRSASGLLVSQNLAAMFHELTNRGEKRVKTLERVRRENMTEMILEPIIGLDSDAYTFISKIPESADDEALRQIAARIETALQKYYSTAAKKIEFLSEAAYAFEILAEKNAEIKNRLSS
jgi:rubrerythrin